MGSGVTGQTRCLHNILTQMKFLAQKIQKSLIIRKSNQLTGYSMLATFSYLFLSNTTQGHFLFQAELPEFSFNRPWRFRVAGWFSGGAEQASTCMLKAQQNTIHQILRQASISIVLCASHSWTAPWTQAGHFGVATVWSRIMRYSVFWKEEHFSPGISASQWSYMHSIHGCAYFSILVWFRSEIFEVNLAVPAPAVLWFLSRLRQQAQTALFSN